MTTDSKGPKITSGGPSSGGGSGGSGGGGGPKQQKPKVVDLNAKFGFTLTVPSNGKTAAQVKAALRNNVFHTSGTIDQIIITPHPDKDSPTEYQARVLFTKLHAKGQAAYDALSRNDPFQVDVFDEKLSLAITKDLKGSGGGRATGTAKLPSNKPPPRGGGRGGRGGGRGGGAEGGAPSRGGGAPRGGGRGGKSGGDKKEEKSDKKDDKKEDKKEDKKAKK